MTPRFSRQAKTAARTLALTAPLFLMTSCLSDITSRTSGPSPWPSGYTYHNAQYKAPAPGKVRFSKEQIESARARSAEYNEQATQRAASDPAYQTPGGGLGSWDEVATTALNKLLGGFGIPNEAVFVEPAGITPRHPELEAALIRALKSRTVPHTYTEGDGPFFLHYSITSASSVQGRDIVTISLLVSRANFLTEATAIRDSGPVAAMEDSSSPVSLTPTLP